MLIGYACQGLWHAAPLPRQKTAGSLTGRSYSQGGSNPRCGVLHGRGVEIHKALHRTHATRIAIKALVDFSESCGL